MFLQKPISCFFILCFFSLFGCSGATTFTAKSVVGSTQEESANAENRRDRESEEERDRESEEERDRESEKSYDICDRTEQVKQAIMKAVDKESCSKVTKEDLKNIKELTVVKHEDLRRLKSGDFFGLTSLENLWMSYNNLESLPEDIFSDQNSLKQLDLGNNQLENLPDNIFSGLNSLKLLSMGFNQLNSLPSFDDLDSLDQLLIGNNKLKDLSKSIFKNKSYLRTLDLCHNQLEEEDLTAELFSDLSLIVLYLNGNPLSAKQKSRIRQDLEDITGHLHI